MLLIVAVGSGLNERAHVLATERSALAQQAAVESQVLDGYFGLANSLIDLTSRNPAFVDYYSLPGERAQRARSTGITMDRVVDALVYLGRMYPSKTGRASFIDKSGAENVRVVAGQLVPPGAPGSEQGNAYDYTQIFALPPGVVHQSRPYLSKDLDDWVISSGAQVLMPDRVRHALVQFEVPLRSIRHQAGATAHGQLLVVDADTGDVVIDVSQPNYVSGLPPDRRFKSLPREWGPNGMMILEGRQAAYHLVPVEAGNANHWYAVTVAPRPVTLLGSVGWLPISVALAALLLVIYMTATLFRSQSALLSAANSDPLTRLHNRRRLKADLDSLVPRATPGQPLLLMLSDLNGFKAYNDAFGHLDGDDLLVRLAGSLSAAVGNRGKAYRIGGDEFCVLARPGRSGVDGLIQAVSAALLDDKRSVRVTASHGAIILPDETTDSNEAMLMVDQRMYRQKNQHYRRAGDRPPPVGPAATSSTRSPTTSPRSSPEQNPTHP